MSLDPNSNLLGSDPGRELLTGLVCVMKIKLAAAQLPPRIPHDAIDPETGEVTTTVIPNPDYIAMGAAEMAAIIKLLSDSSVTLNNIRAGDFGETARRAAEEFPFPQGPTLGSA